MSACEKVAHQNVTTAAGVGNPACELDAGHQGDCQWTDADGEIHTWPNRPA